MNQSDLPPPEWGGLSPEEEQPPAEGTVPPAFLPPPSPRPWGVWATLGWTLLMIGALIAASFAAFPFVLWIKTGGSGGFFRLEPEVVAEFSRNGDMVWISAAWEVILCGAVLFLALFLRRRYPAGLYLALHKVEIKPFLLWIGAFIVFMIASDGVLTVAGVETIPDWMTKVYSSATCMACLYLAVILIAPVVEEAIFRGFIFTGIQARLGPAWAVIFAAVPWAVLHIQYEWYYLVIGLLMGLFLSLARWRTGSLFTPLAMHILNNLVASVQVAFSLS